jgi:Tol biopolymer transport system component
MSRALYLFFAVILVTALFASSGASAAEPKLLIAFSSYRERPKHPQIYFYQHDGVSEGGLLESIPTVNLRSDYHPSLSSDGRFCAYASEMENETSHIALWDRQEKKAVDLPSINSSPNAQLWPSVSGDAQRIAFAAWNRPDSSQRWDVFVYDIRSKQFEAIPDINSLTYDERMPALDGQGKLLAYVTNDKKGAGSTDIALVNLSTGTAEALAGVNSPHRELEPSLSADGRWLAFASERPGGSGGKDIYLYDRQAGKLVDLPGLNSVAHEQTPSITSEGRYLVFVSERIRGEGERDLFLYDRQRQTLLSTPGLNARQEDIDPCIITLAPPGQSPSGSSATR